MREWLVMNDDSNPLVELNEVSFRWLLQTAPDSIVIVDDEGRIVLVNKEVEKVFGYTADELVDKRIETLIPERYRHIHVDHRRDYFAAPRTRPMGIGLELYGRRRDDTEFPVEISLSPVQTEHGLLVMAIVRDVTEFKREHYISSTLQKALLSVILDKVGGVRMASSYHSAYTGSQVGGDFFDAFSIDDELFAIVIGDVSGKGVEAAMRTALGKYSLRAYAYEDPRPSSVMGRLNLTVYNQTGTDSFITMFYGLINIAEDTLSSANAGHMAPMYLPCAGREVFELPHGDLPLGILSATHYKEDTMEFREGDRLLLYTDGVTDARGDKGFFGEENLKEFFLARRSESPGEFIDHLTKRLQEWSGDHLRDDIAMLLVSRE